MKSFRKEIWLNIPSRRGFVNLTRDVETAIHESGIREGLVLVKPNTMPSNTSQGLRVPIPDENP
jgi:thiamine phosphate synthase YjbQ (UPF0047 family)